MTAPYSERLKRILAVVERQANDAGLWCQPGTIGEAYVQYALRHLHAAIEGDEQMEAFYGEQYGEG